MTTDTKPTQNPDPIDNTQNGTSIGSEQHRANGDNGIGSQASVSKNRDLTYRGVTYPSSDSKKFEPENLVLTDNRPASPVLRWFYDLPVRNKQLIGLISSELFSVIGLVGVSSLLIVAGGRHQLLQQSKSELAVIEAQYNIKVNQMGLGFRGQSDNAAIIEAAVAYEAGSTLSNDQRAAVRAILNNEILARDIEYATLVGTDQRIIASANAIRVGEPFDPEGLVSQALSQQEQITASAVVAWEELQAEDPPLPSGFENEDALIRYTVTPVFSNQSLTGVLVSGDIVNRKLPIVKETVRAFESGYAAIYVKNLAGDWVLATSADLDVDETDIEEFEAIYDPSLLDVAFAANGEKVSRRIFERDGEDAGQAYTMAAQAILNEAGSPVAVMVRGTSENSLNELIGNSLKLQFLIAAIALVIDLLIAQLLGRSIVNPLKRLQQATEKFAAGNHREKAEVFARDEVGQVAAAFNDMTVKVLSSENTLRNRVDFEALLAKRTRMQADLASEIRQTLDINIILNRAVSGVLQILKVDRAVFYRFNNPEDFQGGTITAEAIEPGWVRAMGQDVSDPLTPETIERFKGGRISFIQNLEESDLSHCHCEILRKIEVKANIVAPVLAGTQLVGLLCAHQCSGPRQWSEEDFDLMRQLSTQLGYALSQATLLQRQQKAAEKERLLTELVVRMRESVDRETIFRTVVKDARAALQTDRVVVYLFDETWKGTFEAESVAAEWPAALGSEVADPCFAERYVEQYRQGRVQATNNIYNAGLTVCHINQLEPFAVRASLVAPILVGERLLGLLIAHECSGPREWDELEINLLKQTAIQLGFTLEQAELFTQQQLIAQRDRQLSELVTQMRQRTDTDGVLKTTTSQLRYALKTDRVITYRFLDDWTGEVDAESVDSEYASILGEFVNDPMREGFIERYRNGRVRAMNDIYAEELTDCHREILEGFQIRASLVAPIMQQGHLTGLLCVHECAGPRAWQPEEITLFTQVAMQLGYTLEQVGLFEQQRLSAERDRQLSEITVAMRNSTERDRIFETAVTGTRSAVEGDRVIVYTFDEVWNGTIVAESVDSVWPVALNSQIADPCFADTYVQKYVAGRVQATPDIYNAGLTDCHIGQLAQFEVKANLVAPIVVEGRLLGLLIVHQCSGPRDWQETDVNFLRQVAVQLGFALEQATLFKRQQLTAEREQQLTQITLAMRDSTDRDVIFNTVVKEARATLTTDRVVVYTFNEDWEGTILAESVDSAWPSALNRQITDPCFANEYVQKYQNGRVQATPDIYDAGLTSCHIGQLAEFEVKANLVAPILIEDRLLGLLVAHECSGPRDWNTVDIEFFRKLAVQLGFALEQAEARSAAEILSEERRQRQESMQMQLLNLLEDVEGAARGDLTVRADVTVGEIGTVADFFNSIVESLRQIVTQVKTSASQVNNSLGDNEAAIRTLAQDALTQVEKTAQTLDSVEAMTLSITQVADQAKQAASVAKTASTTAQEGEIAMDLTVQNILNLRETVGQTAKKVKRLGESSQQISKVVSLINQIAMQTNLLAINAGIEAARAGEEGQGFAAVAEEVGELAARSSAATQEIEQIVDSIQRETSDVVEAIEQSTSQVVEGTRRVEDSKQSLTKILDVSRQIDELVQAISGATVSQAQTSTAVAELMQQISVVSQRTSDSSLQVSDALRETVEVAEELQTSMATFKVDNPTS
ncbi:MAG: GAF domain-containing protein [Cyanobacteria bacterium P01_A01_bin.114]